ncbi:MAG TPA: plasmid stabilization protein [Actinomycetes bacterium]|nr:plasmid stabilization protein [Actinomycetes bacterium]
MPRAWSDKRERQYEHIKSSAKSSGASTDRAQEIAARTVNKERARAGESRTASRASIRDRSSSSRGGSRSHRGSQGPTYQQLYNEAKHRNVKGRSSMNKSQLKRALAAKKS